MSGLNLNVAGSRAKLDGALDRLRTIQTELPAAVEQDKPYSLLTEFDERTGWLSVKIRTEPPNLRFSVIVGELVHDLRSALDHVVAVLVAANNGRLTRSHQFPIYSREAAFNDKVGTADRPKGCLSGVKLGFAEIRSFQPFTDPYPDEVALALLHRLSNSDKHRSVLAFAAFPNSHNLRLELWEAVVLEEWHVPRGSEWQPDRDVEVARYRLVHWPDPPPKWDVQAELNFHPGFLDVPFPPDYADTILFTIEDLTMLCSQVEVVIDAVAAI